MPVSKQNLISYWKLDESSGTRVDSHGSYDLTEVASTPSGTGKINNGIEPVAGTPFSRLSAGDISDLEIDDEPFCISVWVQIANKSNDITAVTKGDEFTTGIEYRLKYLFGTDELNFEVGGTTVQANALGSPTLNTWYHVYCWHDPDSDIIGIRINDSLEDTIAHSTGSAGEAKEFMVGNGVNSIIWEFQEWIGKIDELGIWKGRLLESSEITTLYNGGNGYSYDLFVDQLPNDFAFSQIISLF